MGGIIKWQERTNGWLTQLQDLDICFTKISELPECIALLPLLTDLELFPEDITTPPPEITSQGIEAIRSYFESLSTGQKILYDAKLILIGRAEVGKTSMRKKIIDKTSSTDENESRTEGIEITRWKPNIMTKDGEQEFNISIWDFAGQEIMYTTHRFFLTAGALYLLVWNNTDGWEADLDYWLQIVRIQGGSHAPIIMVQNKVDATGPEDYSNASKQKFSSNLKGRFSVSAKTGREMIYLDDAIKEQLSIIQGSKWPSNWLEVRYWLESQKEKYIGFDQYLDVCTKHSIDKVAGRTLINGLSISGIIYYYEENYNLSQYIILDPQWATKAIHRLLNNNIIRDKYGQFNIFDAKTVWDEGQYKGIEQQLFLELMVEFQFCFLYKDRDSTLSEKIYIIPELLAPEEKPEIDWDDVDNIRLKYQYPLVPIGIIGKFMAMKHKYIEKKCFGNMV